MADWFMYLGFGLCYCSVTVMLCLFTGGAPKSDSFGDLLGGLSMPMTAPPLLPPEPVAEPPQAGGVDPDSSCKYGMFQQCLGGLIN